MAESICVCIRVRKFLQREDKSAAHWKWERKLSQIWNPVHADRKWTFDHVVTPKETNSDLYDQLVRPTIDQVVSGFNATVFAYGQTSSGGSLFCFIPTYNMLVYIVLNDILELQVKRTPCWEILRILESFRDPSITFLITSTPLQQRNNFSSGFLTWRSITKTSQISSSRYDFMIVFNNKKKNVLFDIQRLNTAD